MRRFFLIVVMFSLLLWTTGCNQSSQSAVEEVALEEVTFEGNTVKSDDGLFELKLLEGFNLYLEEPNKYVISNESTGETFARIEWLESGFDQEALKSTLIESYKTVGDVTELAKDELTHPFLKKCAFVLQVAQNNTSNAVIEIAVASFDQTQMIVYLFHSSEPQQESLLTDFWNMSSTIKASEREK